VWLKSSSAAKCYLARDGNLSNRKPNVSVAPALTRRCRRETTPDEMRRSQLKCWRARRISFGRFDRWSLFCRRIPDAAFLPKMRSPTHWPGIDGSLLERMLVHFPDVIVCDRSRRPGHRETLRSSLVGAERCRSRRFICNRLSLLFRANGRTASNDGLVGGTLLPSQRVRNLYTWWYLVHLLWAQLQGPSRSLQDLTRPMT
jgi:hypothetical protein